MSLNKKIMCKIILIIGIIYRLKLKITLQLSQFKFIKLMKLKILNNNSPQLLITIIKVNFNMQMPKEIRSNLRMIMFNLALKYIIKVRTNLFIQILNTANIEALVMCILNNRQKLTFLIRMLMSLNQKELYFLQKLELNTSQRWTWRLRKEIISYKIRETFIKTTVKQRCLLKQNTKME